MKSNKTPGAAVHGVLLLDKPRGITSQAALFRVRRALGAAKAGHGGTLDPLADGLLILCFGAATKFAQRHLEADKRYTARVRLGETTTTDDAEGEVTQRLIVSIDRAQVEAVLPRFVGTIAQTPPLHSALKRDGKPLYAYARAGETVDVAPRAVRIDSIHVLGLDDGLLTLDVRCGKGTYIRALARDIGVALACGAHLAGLTRTESAGFRLDQAIGLDAAETAGTALREQLLPPDALLQDLPRQDLEYPQATAFLQGRRLSGLVPLPDAATGSEIRVYGPPAVGAPDMLLGVGARNGAELVPRRLLSPEELGSPTPPQPRSGSGPIHQDATP